MTPGTLILLHAPGSTAGSWGDLPEMLRSYGLDVVVPDIPEAFGMRYVARASLVISATGPTVPLVLIGYDAAGPLLPAIATAQRAAHRPVGGYVFIDAALPWPARSPHRHNGDRPEETVVLPADWPDAPCGYLHMAAERAPEARLARLRGWTVKELLERVPPVDAPPSPGAAQAVSELIAVL